MKDSNDLADAAKAGKLLRAQRSGEEIAKCTREGMAKKKAEVTTFGNPDILKAQRLGADAVSAKSDALVKAIADVLRSIPGHDKLSRADVADILNARRIVTGAGLPWTTSRVTGPLKNVKSMLSAERSVDEYTAARAHPDFGRF